MADLFIGILTLVVLPALINKTTEDRLHSIKPYLREIWLVVGLVYSVYILTRERTLVGFMKLHQSLGAQYPKASYIIVATACAAIGLGYWWFLGTLVPPLRLSGPKTPGAEESTNTPQLGTPSVNAELPPPHKAPPPKPPKTSGTFKELPPLAQPEKKPTFKEILGPYKVIVGSNTMILSEKNTKENPMHLIKFGDWASLDAYVDEGKLYVDALLFGDYNRPAVTIRHNEFTSPPQNWDRNYDDSALEIVDGNLLPRFQLIYRDQRTVVINGVYQYPGGLLVMTDDGMVLNPLPPLRVSMRRIFKYPSRLYQGQEITPQ